MKTPVLLALIAAAWPSPAGAAPPAGPGVLPPARLAPLGSQQSGSQAASFAQQAELADFLARLKEALASPEREGPEELLNALEHWMPAWQTEQRRNSAGPLENLLTTRVVTNFDVVLNAFRTGSRERRLVAAWALGFSRVPDNDLGIVSPHPIAVSALSDALATADDALMRNVLLGLWKIGEPTTPIRPIVDLMVRHHDADVRADAALALSTILDAQSAQRVVDSVLVALGDREDKVRLHAALIARRFPGAATTTALLQRLPAENTPLVRAAIGAALGSARSLDAAPQLVAMLGSSRQIEAVSARQALVAIFEEDRGPDPEDWKGLLP